MQRLDLKSVEGKKKEGEVISFHFLRVYLLGGEIWLMENFGEKMERETFLECIWLGGKINDGA